MIQTAASAGRISRRAAGVLVGPTASGKTDVAHVLARRIAGAIVSADSMLVYRGMDVGTAKPDARERENLAYHGIDLVEPDRPFSVGDYVRGVRESLAWAGGEAPLIVAGGTGLYVRCLVEGLDPHPPASPELRARAAEILSRDGMGGLQRWLEQLAPGALASLPDPRNPRRLVRAIERAAGATGAAPAPRAPAAPPPRVFAGLLPSPEALQRRIGARVRRLFEGGLLDEAAALRRRYGGLSATARQAIGYREAFDCLDGRIGLDEAMEQTVVRTRQLARRQMTWFRRQARVEWIEWSEREPSPEDLARRVEEVWERHGPVELAL